MAVYSSISLFTLMVVKTRASSSQAATKPDVCWQYRVPAPPSEYIISNQAANRIYAKTKQFSRGRLRLRFEHWSTIQLYKFFDVPQIKMLCIVWTNVTSILYFEKIFRTPKIFVTDEIQSRIRRITCQFVSCCIRNPQRIKNLKIQTGQN